MMKLRETFLYKYLASQVHKISVKINPENEMRRAYYKVFQRKPNLKAPQDLIEKIYWMQLHTNTSLWTECADKYALRRYVKECGYEEFLPKNYGKWDNVKDIDFSILPSEFVLKTNNGCGTVLIVRDKCNLDKKATIKKIQQWLKISFGWSGAELHYTHIKPCIIAEELLHQGEEQNSFSPKSIADYKVWCINGMPESILMVFNRSENSYNLDLYDTEWNRISHNLKKNGHFVFCEKEIPRPKCLKEMLKMAQILSRPFPEVRVDFYIINDKPIIGELTFTTGYGYFTEEYYSYLGNKMIISK